MFKLLFASGHGGSTKEIKTLCDLAGVKLLLPGKETQTILKHLASEKEAETLGLHCLSTITDIEKAISNKEVDGWLVATPETIENIKKTFKAKIPIAARHSVNAFSKYQRLELKNFMSPSKFALQQMNAPNSYLSVKVRDFQEYDLSFPSLPKATERKGYFSYIHHYKRYWKRAKTFFEDVCKNINGAVHIENFGAESEKGIVNDRKTMINSKATIHIKDGQVCCNAPITSICLGIPVLMDYETLKKLGMEDYIIHNVSGLLFETVQECVNIIRTLETQPDYLDELSEKTKAFSRLKCKYNTNDIREFRNFLYHLR